MMYENEYKRLMKHY